MIEAVVPRDVKMATKVTSRSLYQRQDSHNIMEVQPSQKIEIEGKLTSITIGMFPQQVYEHQAT